MFEHISDTKNSTTMPPEVNRLVGPVYDKFFQSNHWSDTDVATLEDEHIKLYETLNDFCGDQIDSHAFSAAMLSDIYGLKDDTVVGRNAKRALRDCFTHCDTQNDAKYVLGLLEDEVNINRFWQENSPYIIDNESEETDEWRSKDKVVDFEQLSKLINNINLESLLISSVKTLNYLRENNDKTPEVLDKIRQAESMLAPVCEIIGFDGLAMALNNASIITRFNHTKRRHHVDLATDLINMYGSSETIFDAIEGGMAECLGNDVAADYDYAVNSMPKDPAHRTLFIHGLADSKSTGGELDIKGRLKTVGSLAKKLYDSAAEKGHIEIPMDIIATTIVTADVDQSAKVFDLITKNLSTNPNTTLLPSPSKGRALYIQGEPSFIGKIIENKDRNGEIEVKEVSVEDGIQVVKVTFEYHSPLINAPLRMETQIVTLADRMNMRYGARCHSFVYKGKTKLEPITLKMLDKIHGRKEHIKERELVAPSERLDEIYEEIINIDQPKRISAGKTAVKEKVDF